LRLFFYFPLHLGPLYTRSPRSFLVCSQSRSISLRYGSPKFSGWGLIGSLAARLLAASLAFFSLALELFPDKPVSGARFPFGDGKTHLKSYFLGNAAASTRDTICFDVLGSPEVHWVPPSIPSHDPLSLPRRRYPQAMLSVRVPSVDRQPPLSLFLTNVKSPGLGS